MENHIFESTGKRIRIQNCGIGGGRTGQFTAATAQLSKKIIETVQYKSILLLYNRTVYCYCTIERYIAIVQ